MEKTTSEFKDLLDLSGFPDDEFMSLDILEDDIWFSSDAQLTDLQTQVEMRSADKHKNFDLLSALPELNGLEEEVKEIAATFVNDFRLDQQNIDYQQIENHDHSKIDKEINNYKKVIDSRTFTRPKKSTARPSLTVIIAQDEGRKLERRLTQTIVPTPELIPKLEELSRTNNRPVSSHCDLNWEDGCQEEMAELEGNRSRHQKSASLLKKFEGLRSVNCSIASDRISNQLEEKTNLTQRLEDLKLSLSENAVEEKQKHNRHFDLSLGPIKYTFMEDIHKMKFDYVNVDDNMDSFINLTESNLMMECNMLMEKSHLSLLEENINLESLELDKFKACDMYAQMMEKDMYSSGDNKYSTKVFDATFSKNRTEVVGNGRGDKDDSPMESGGSLESVEGEKGFVAYSTPKLHPTKRISSPLFSPIIKQEEQPVREAEPAADNTRILYRDSPVRAPPRTKKLNAAQKELKLMKPLNPIRTNENFKRPISVPSTSRRASELNPAPAPVVATHPVPEIVKRRQAASGIPRPSSIPRSSQIRPINRFRDQ